jgi:hypothetical protein
MGWKNQKNDISQQYTETNSNERLVVCGASLLENQIERY